MQTQPTILIVHRRTPEADPIAAGLRAAGYSPQSRELERAFEHIRSGAPDIVLLDDNLLGALIMHTCRHIREISAVPILMVLEAAGEQRVVAALEQGADLVLLGPISARELAARIGSLLRRVRKTYGQGQPA